MSKKLKGNLLLLLTSIIWGSSFVSQKAGMGLIGPFAFNGTRTVMGSIVLLPLIFFMDRKRKADGIAPAAKEENRLLLKGGICCAIPLFFAANIQQIGIIYTSAGHSGFITALYVVLVPLCGLFVHKRVRPITWACVFASAVGLYMLCIPAGGFGAVNKGDIITLICALCFTFHILVIDYFSPKVDGVKLSCLQFFFAGAATMLLMFPLDPLFNFPLPTISGMIGSAVPLLYSGVMSCGVGYTLQVVAQKDTDPTIASMIMCLESVFALLAGMVLLHEMLSIREVFGCIIMFAAIIVSQLPDKNELQNH